MSIRKYTLNDNKLTTLSLCRPFWKIAAFSSGPAPKQTSNLISQILGLLLFNPLLIHSYRTSKSIAHPFDAKVIEFSLENHRTTLSSFLSLWTHAKHTDTVQHSLSSFSGSATHDSAALYVHVHSSSPPPTQQRRTFTEATFTFALQQQRKRR